MLKLRDRMGEGVPQILEKVVSRMKRVSDGGAVPADIIANSNAMLLELARHPKSKKEDFAELVEQLKHQFNYLVQL